MPVPGAPHGSGVLFALPHTVASALRAAAALATLDSCPVWIAIGLNGGSVWISGRAWGGDFRRPVAPRRKRPSEKRRGLRRPHRSAESSCRRQYRTSFPIRERVVGEAHSRPWIIASASGSGTPWE